MYAEGSPPLRVMCNRLVVRTGAVPTERAHASACFISRIPRLSTTSFRYIHQRRTPLMNAILCKSDEMSSLCMEHSVSLHAVDIQWGWTALHCAANVGMTKVAEELLKKRASPYVKSLVRFEEFSPWGHDEADHRPVGLIFFSILTDLAVPHSGNASSTMLLYFCKFYRGCPEYHPRATSSTGVALGYLPRSLTGSLRIRVPRFVMMFSRKRAPLLSAECSRT